MNITKAIERIIPCLVFRDHREKEVSNRWTFRKSEICAGTEDCHLETGDYTIQGFEKYVVIERKASVTDFVTSIAKSTFREELIRMTDFAHAFIILEFPFEDLTSWPASSGKSYFVQKKLPLRYRKAALAKYLNLKLEFPHIDFVFAGSCGKELAGSIFKRIIEAYAQEIVDKSYVKNN